MLPTDHFSLSSSLPQTRPAAPAGALPRYALYARKSTESEERQVQSIDDQVRLAHELAARHGLPLACTITESMSAKETGRPAFNRLLAQVERGEVQGLLAWHPDRLSRNELDAARLTYLVRKGRLNLRFVNYHFDPSPEGIMMLQMALSQSQYFSSKLSKDVLRGMDSKRAKGWFPHRAPEGYLNDLELHTVVADPDRFPLIRQGWEMLLTGAYSIQQIIDALNAKGYRTKKRKNSGGGPLSRSSGYKIFTSVFYTGQFQTRGLIHAGGHPPMITQDEYERAQTYIGRRGKQHAQTREFAYSSLMRCARCGWGVTAQVQEGAHKSGIYTYYHCSNRLCTRQSIREDRFEAQVAILLARLTISSEFAALAQEELTQWRQGDAGQQEVDHKRQQSAITEAERQQAALLDLRLRELLTDDEYRTKKGQLGEQITGLQQEVARTQGRSESSVQTVETALHFAELAYRLFQSGDCQVRRIIVMGLGLTLRLEEGRVEIEINPICACLMQMNDSQANEEQEDEVSQKHIKARKRGRTHEIRRPVPAVSPVHLSKIGSIKPVIIGSGSTKTGSMREPCLAGWASDSLSKPLSLLFGVVQQGFRLPDLRTLPEQKPFC